MKISCQSCQAKYTIADEKVLGKIVKIRCKKCGATIVINGNESGAGLGGSSIAPPAEAFDYGPAGGESWTVNVADGDQRTMTTDEVSAALKNGTINDETYCWKDGMADWMPIREIAELQSLLSGGSGQSPDATHQDQEAQHAAPGFPGIPSPPDDEHEMPTKAVDVPSFAPLAAAASSNGNGAAASLFGGGGSTPAPAPTAARRQGGRAGGGMDLFGNVTHAGGEDDVMTSAPAGMPQPHDEPGKLTGQRNENSVLFSLNALTQNAPKQDAPTGGTEGSGLIDIRALSASMGDKSSERKNHVDDIMNLGGGGAFSAALAAPVLAPPAMDGGFDAAGQPRKDNTKLIVAAIVGTGLLIAIVLILVIVLKKPAETTVAPTAMATDSASAAATAPNVPGASTATAPDPAASAAAASGATAAAVAPGAGGAAAPGTGEAASPTAPGDHHAAATHHHGGGGGAVASGGDDSSPKPFTPPAAAPAAGGGGTGSLDDQIRKSMGGAAPAAAPQAAPQSTAQFDRGAAVAALGSINVAGCKKSDGPTGSGHLKITFSPSGSVSSAVVDQPPFAGTGVGGCVAGKFRSAHVPPFGGSPVTVGKSFSID